MSRHDYVLVGTGLYPDDGFTLVASFVLEEAANALCELCTQYEFTRPSVVYESDAEFDSEMERIENGEKNIRVVKMRRRIARFQSTK